MQGDYKVKWDLGAGKQKIYLKDAFRQWHCSCYLIRSLSLLLHKELARRLICTVLFIYLFVCRNCVLVIENIRLNEPSTSHLIVFISGKLFFVLHKMVIPSIILGFWRMVSFSFLSKIILGSRWLIAAERASIAIYYI